MMEQSGNRDEMIHTDAWMPIYLKGLKEGRKVKLTPFGFSMYPLLVGGRDSLILRGIDRELRRGDICLYRRDNGIYVTHSVHHVDKEGIYLIGESQKNIEGPLTMDHMLAYAEEFVRKGKLYSCDKKSYKISHEIWMILRPLRPMLIKIYRKIMKY